VLLSSLSMKCTILTHAVLAMPVMGMTVSQTIHWPVLLWTHSISKAEEQTLSLSLAQMAMCRHQYQSQLMGKLKLM